MMSSSAILLLIKSLLSTQHNILLIDLSWAVNDKVIEPISRYYWYMQIKYRKPVKILFFPFKLKKNAN